VDIKKEAPGKRNQQATAATPDASAMPEARHGRPEATGDGDGDGDGYGDGDAEARLQAYRVVGNHNSLRSPVPLPRRA